MDDPGHDQVDTDRRSFMSTFSKAALIAPPVITAMLSTSLSSPAIAKSTGGGGGGGGKGNNGVGNGPDPQPAGNPKMNDGAGTRPGNPGNKGGHGKQGGMGNKATSGSKRAG